MPYCNPIREFSSTVYWFLSDVFNHGLSFSELGLTDHFVLHIAKINRSLGLTDAEIYKATWKRESIYGNDLDLFIQNSSGTFNWYALQAKVMNSNGEYTDLKQKNVIKQQWHKLQDHESSYGSKAFYLLYNGMFNSTMGNVVLKRGDCVGVPPIDELGLGIVDVNDICSLRVSMTPSQPIHFNQLCPDYMDSIRKLFCCIETLPPTKKQYLREEINTTGYMESFHNVKEFKDLTNLPDGAAPIRIIVTRKEIRNY